MGNNILLSGMPEQLWELHESTKERLIEAISASMGSKDNEAVKAEARKIDITCCSRVGTYILGKPHLICHIPEKRR